VSMCDRCGNRQCDDTEQEPALCAECRKLCEDCGTKVTSDPPSICLPCAIDEVKACGVCQ
jgi:hypothetical protein